MTNQIENRIKGNCKYCNKSFIKSRKSHLFCSVNCMKKEGYERRSSQMPIDDLKRMNYHTYLANKDKETNPIRYKAQKWATNNLKPNTKCYFCSNTKYLQIHHLIYRVPNQEKDYITLCKSCHNKIHFIDKIKNEFENDKVALTLKDEKEFLENWYSIACYKSNFKDDMIENRLKKLEQSLSSEEKTYD